MSILSGPEIREAIVASDIVINPYNPDRVQPNSVDLTLGDEVCVYRDVTNVPREFTEAPRPFEPSPLGAINSLYISRTIVADNSGYLDARRPNAVHKFTIDGSGWIVKPGICYLMHTEETIYTPKYVTQLNGKSSIGRLSVIVHYTAAFGETGFKGQYTLEVAATHPVKLYRGMPIAQAIFYTVEGDVEDYADRGHYTRESARGAVPSKSYEQT